MSRDYDDIDISLRGNRGENIPNYLAQAIMVTLCCCLPFGIAAIVNAAKVNTLIANGDLEGAQRASDEAKKWCLVSFILGIIGNSIYIAIQFADINRGAFR